MKKDNDKPANAKSNQPSESNQEIKKSDVNEGGKSGFDISGKLSGFKGASPKVYKTIVFSFIAIALVIVAVLVWLNSKPDIKKISGYVDRPGITDYEYDGEPESLSLRFSGSVAKLEDVQKDVPKGISIEPIIAGSWKWLKDDKLEFTPKQDWQPGTEYTILLAKDLFPEHIKLKKYEYTFTTQDFSLRITNNEFYIDPTDEDLKQISATIKFSHPVETSTFENNIELRPYKLDDDIKSFSNRDYNFTITYNETKTQAYLLSEALPMPEDNVKMQLEVKKGVQSVLKGNETPKEKTSLVTIPGITNFIKILSVDQDMVRNEDYKLEQILIVDTKGKVRIEDLFKNTEAYILPYDKPAEPGLEKQKHYYWSNPDAVSKTVLEHSKKINLQALPNEHEYEDLNSFKISVEPKKYLFIKIKKGTPFYGKYKLFKDYKAIVKIKEFPKQLEIMHDGIILSSNGQKKISLMAQGIEDIEIRIGRVLPDQLNHLVSQTNGNLTNLHFNNYNFSEENIVENYYDYKRLNNVAPGEVNYFSFDFSKYLAPKESGKVRNGIFFLEVKEDTKYYRAMSDKRLIMVSDLGVLVKDRKDDAHDIYIQSISTGLPVLNAKIQVVGKNGIPVLTAFTDNKGHARFPYFGSFKKEKKPVVYIISKGQDLTFMPVNAPGRWLNYSRFDVGGVHGATDPNKVEAYLFSDRGIYRPGDEFNIGMIVKSGNWSKTLKGTPIEATIEDPRGLQIYKTKYALPADGFNELQYKTESSSPTGTYQINLYTVEEKKKYRRHIGSTTILVEEFIPDRLTINTFFPGATNLAWVKPENLKGLVSLRNLFGAPAAGNRISASITLSPGRMWFKEYRDFNFIDPMNSDRYFSEELQDMKTDKEGKALFDLGLHKYEAATYSLRFSATGFEKEGGRNVSAESRILVSPMPYLIGTKANGDLSYIYKNTERNLKIIAINPELKKSAVNDLKFETYVIQQVSVLTKLPNGTYKYKSVPKRVLLSSEKKNIPANGLTYALKTSEPGEYELLIKNEKGVQFSRVAFSVVGQGNLTRSLDKTAELEIKLNKKDYEPGEEIEIYIKAPYKGAGLITIEREKIYASKWFKSTSNSFLTKITLPASLEGNGYINVAFVRAADSKEIYMSPLSYGIAPFSVSKKNRINKIDIDIPAQARSGEVFPIKYKTAKPARIVVFAVDEGILQVAGYQTPDPLAHFFKKRALEVQTSQLLDLILPDFALFESRMAMGGGSGFDDIAKNLNPFKRKQNKPVAYWSGIIESGPQQKTLEYTVPDYFNGTLRVMAIAVSEQAIGRFEEKSIVKNPFIISPNAPMFAAPKDSFVVSATITNGIAGSKKPLPMKLEISSSKNLQISQKNYTFALPENGDTTLSFFVYAKNDPGSAEINFKVSGGKEVTRLSSYLSVRPAIPYQTKVISGVLKDDDVAIEIERRMYEDYRILKTSVSYVPLGLSKGLLDYLDSYPYGCTEQIVSRAFPYLYLQNVTGFKIDKKTAEEKINYAIKILQARQDAGGRFGIWGANTNSSEFIDVYATNFLSECKQKGYYVPQTLMDKALNGLKVIAKKKYKDIRNLRVQAYAIYMLTANEIITTNYIASTRKYLEKLDIKWQTDLTSAYLASAYSIMQQKKEAATLFEALKMKPIKKDFYWNFYSMPIHNTQILYLMSKYAPDQVKNISANALANIAEFLEDNSYNTINSSLAIMALNEYSDLAGIPQDKKMSLKQIFADKSEHKMEIPNENFPTLEFSEKAVKLEIENEEKLPLFYQVVQAGYENNIPEKRIVEGIELYREFTDMEGDKIDAISMGDEIQVHLKFRSIDKKRLYNVAIVDLLPAGLEIIASSVRDQMNSNWHPDYRDIREDRLILYGTITEKMQEFVYSARAINRGVYTVPPLFAEAMYDQNIFGYNPQEPIIVK